MHESETSEYEAHRVRMLRRARRVQGAGGLFLASCFVLPMFENCGRPFVPALEAYRVASDPTSVTLDFLGVVVICIAPYLLGVLTFLIARRSRTYDPGREQTLGRSVAVLLGISVAIVLAASSWEIIDNGWDSGAGAFLLVSGVACVYWVMGVGRGMGGLLCLRWFAVCCCIAWFTFVAFNAPMRFGLWMSLIAGVVMLAALTAEARTWGGLTWMRTVAGLATCRLTVFPLDEPRCRVCGYLLIGLTACRCPECGTVFSRDPSERTATTVGEP